MGGKAQRTAASKGRGTEPRPNLAASSPLPSELAALLDRAIELLARGPRSVLGLREAFQELARRLETGRFHLAVLGQFKRGKSTLLNALLGREVLPTAVVPLTAIPTLLCWGHEEGASVHFHAQARKPERLDPAREDLAAFLGRFVTESANPENRLGVSHVEVRLALPLLRSGVVLIDTPGIGSTLRHNTETTRSFLRRCDAGLFVLSSDPPITETELAFLREVKAELPRLFFLMNKVDYLSPAERREAVAFARRVLVEQAGFEQAPELFCVSARRALEARLRSDREGWRASGVDAVEERLVRFLAREKRATLRRAVSLRARAFVAEARQRLALERRALELPLDDLEQRLRLFEEKLSQVERERVATADQLDGDLKRLREGIEDRVARLRHEAKERLTKAVEEAFGPTEADAEQRAARQLAATTEAFFERELGRTAAEVEASIQELLGAHRERAEAHVAAIRRAAAEAFELPLREVPPEEDVRERTRPYWVTRSWQTSLRPLASGWLDRLLPPAWRRRRARARLLAEVDDLVRRNVENLRWALIQRAQERFRAFASRLDERLAEVTEATRGVIRDAVRCRSRRADRVQPQLERLGRLEAELEAVQAALERSAPTSA